MATSLYNMQLAPLLVRYCVPLFLCQIPCAFFADVQSPWHRPPGQVWLVFLFLFCSLGCLKLSGVYFATVYRKTCQLSGRTFLDSYMTSKKPVLACFLA